VGRFLEMSTANLEPSILDDREKTSLLTQLLEIIEMCFKPKEKLKNWLSKRNVQRINRLLN